MADIIEGIDLKARSTSEVDYSNYDDVRTTLLANPGQAVIVSEIADATNTSNEKQVKKHNAFRSRLTKELDAIEGKPYKLAGSVRMIEGRGSVSLLAVVANEG